MRKFKLFFSLLALSINLAPAQVFSSTSNFVEKADADSIYNLSAVSFVSSDDLLELRDWWELYADDNLDNLVSEVIKNNHDQKIALNRLEASYYQARASLAREFPSLSIGTQYNGQKNPENLTAFPVGRLNNPGPRVFAPGKWVNIYSLPINLNYEPDFFLKNRLKTKSKDLLAKASFNEAELNRLNVAYKTTEAYFNLANLEKQIEFRKEILDLNLINYDLEKALFEKGLIDKTILETRTEAILKEKIYLKDLNYARDILESDIAFLMAAKPYLDINTLDISKMQIPEINPQNLSSEMLLNRPDVKLSETLLAASDIDVRIARRAYLPSFTLTVQNSLSSVDISNLVSPESLLVAIVAGMTQTIFTAGAREAELNYAKEKNEELFNVHSKTLLTALKESELALKNLDKSEQLYNYHLEKELAILNKLNLESAKAKAGIISELELNRAKIENLETKAKSSDAKAARLIAFSNLAKALGGRLSG